MPGDADETALVAGVDGCRGGWVVVVAEVEPFRVTAVDVVGAIAPVVADTRLTTVAIDMPIGLPEDGPRACDRTCRAAIGPRRSSVFPVPVRDVLVASDYADALRRQRHATGSGLSVQAWGLVPRIAELDDALEQVGPRRRDRVVETHPELAFATLGGAPMRHPKRTTAGRRERLAVLRPHVPDRWTRPSSTPRGAAGDDVLDTLVLAVRAAAWATGGAVVEFADPHRDRRGRRVRIRG